MRRRLPLTSWLILVLALLALAYNAFMLGFLLLFPTDGCRLELGPEGFMIQAAPAGSPLRPGDLVTAINGREIGRESARPGQW